MIDADVSRLADLEGVGGADTSIEGIWAGVRAAEARRRLARVLLACQVVVMAAAMGGGAVWGEQSAARDRLARREVLTLAPGAELAPSSLLMGADVWSR